MKICSRCGSEYADNVQFCGACGASLPPPVPVEPTPVADDSLLRRMGDALNDKLFLAVCVLLSVSVGMGVLAFDSLPIITILVMIFCWIVYARARKGSVDAKILRSISGTTFASFVLYIVAASFMVFAASLTFVAAPFFQRAINNEAIRDVLARRRGWDIFNHALERHGRIILIAVGILLLVAAALCVLRAVATRKLHLFLKDTYTALPNGDISTDVNGTVAWTTALGVFVALSAFGEKPTVFFQTGTLAAAIFIVAALIKKYFVKPQ